MSQGAVDSSTKQECLLLTFE